MSEEIEFEFNPEVEEPVTAFVGLMGEVDEESAQGVISNLVSLNGGTLFSGTPVEDALPIEFLISTSGGGVQDMFAIYDVMRIIRSEREIHTYAVGKTMSAGVLLLAAGTRGKRRIGKHCRIMMHHVMSAEQGPLPNMQSTYREAHVMEKMMFEAIAAESNLTVKEIRKMCSKNVDVFFTAEEAVKMGIADIIV